MREAKEIITQTLELARDFYSLQGYHVRAGFRFDLSLHPQEKLAWRMACAAQSALTDTNVNDAFDELEGEYIA